MSGERGEKNTFILSRISKIQIILLFKISTWMWPGVGPGKAYPCGNGGMGWNGTALPPSALHMDLFLFLYPTIGWGHKRIPGIKPFLRAQPKLPFSAEKKREKIPRKTRGRQSDNFLLPQLPVCQERRLLLGVVDGRIHKMREKRWEATEIPSICMKIPTGAPKPGESCPGMSCWSRHGNGARLCSGFLTDGASGRFFSS